MIHANRGRATKSGEPQAEELRRLGDLLGLADVAVDHLPDDAVGERLDVLAKLFGEREVLRPQGALVEGLGRTHLQGAVAPPWFR